MATSYLDKTGLTYFWGKIKDYIAETIPPKMTILSYGNSTWDDFIAAYESNTIVYCRASSNSNPATGNQTRMAFMAYVNSTPPTEVQFQYYRSVSSHSATQQGDQVYIYKLNKNTGWSVTVREAMSKIAAGAGLASTYKNGTITLSSTVPNHPCYSTTLNTLASTFSITHSLNTPDVQVSVIAMEPTSTYMVPMAATTSDLAYMVDVVNNNTINLKFSKELNGTYHVNILDVSN